MGFIIGIISSFLGFLFFLFAYKFNSKTSYKEGFEPTDCENCSKHGCCKFK